MTVTYITSDGSLAVPDEPNSPLDAYHDDFNDILGDIDLIGLTGCRDKIRRIVVSDELGQSAKSDIETYLNTEIRRVDFETS